MISKDRSKYQNGLYFIAFAALSVLRLCQGSILINLPIIVEQSVLLFSSVLFLYKFFTDKHSPKTMLIVSLLSIVFLYLYFVTETPFLLTAFLAIISIKNVDIKKVIKIDLAIKTTFLLTHIAMFLLDYATGENMVFESINYYASKGTVYAFYFTNQNTTGQIGTWIAIDLLLLKKDRKKKDYLISFIIAMIVFILTKSRTAFYAYIVYISLGLLRKEKVVTAVQQIMYPLLLILSYLAISQLSVEGESMLALNDFFSGRLGNSIMVFRMTGLKILPDALASSILSEYIIDNFYVRCFVCYGIITAVFYYLPHLLLVRKKNIEAKRISIMTSIYLFSESAISNIGFGIPYLLIGDAFINDSDKKKEKNEKTNKN